MRMARRISAPEPYSRILLQKAVLLATTTMRRRIGGSQSHSKMAQARERNGPGSILRSVAWIPCPTSLMVAIASENWVNVKGGAPETGVRGFVSGFPKRANTPAGFLLHCTG